VIGTAPRPGAAVSDELGHLFHRFGATFKRGDTIVHQGDQAQDLYVVLQGQVEFWTCENGQRHLLGTAGPGDVFGEVACFTGLSRSANASADEDTVVLRFDPTAAYELVERSPQLAVRIIATLAARLRARTA
jgi:CRP-like cAMP-binding protein